MVPLWRVRHLPCSRCSGRRVQCGSVPVGSGPGGRDVLATSLSSASCPGAGSSEPPVGCCPLRQPLDPWGQSVGCGRVTSESLLFCWDKRTVWQARRSRLRVWPAGSGVFRANCYAGKSEAETEASGAGAGCLQGL